MYFKTTATEHVTLNIWMFEDIYLKKMAFKDRAWRRDALRPNENRKVPRVSLDHQNSLRMFYVLSLFISSGFTILHSPLTLYYNCHFSYILVLQMLSHFEVSFILTFFHVIPSVSGLSLVRGLLWGHLGCSSFSQRKSS